MSDFPDFTPIPEWEEYFQSNSYPAGNTVLEMLVSWSLKANAIAKYLSEHTGNWEGFEDAISELQNETAYLIPALAVLQTQVNSLPYMPIPIYDPNAVQGDVYDATNHQIALPGITASNVSAAITELLGKINYNVGVIATKMSAAVYDPNAINDDAFDSANHSYDNALSGITSETVKLAIDELVSMINALITFGDIHGTPTNGKSIFYDGANSRSQWLDAYDKSTIDALLSNKVTTVNDTWQTCTMGTFVGGNQAGNVKCKKDITGQYLEIYAYLTQWENPVADANYLFLLPVGYRPSHRIDITIYGMGSSADYEPGWLQINTTGEVTVHSPIWGSDGMVYFTSEYYYIKIPLTLPSL